MRPCFVHAGTRYQDFIVFPKRGQNTALTAAWSYSSADIIQILPKQNLKNALVRQSVSQMEKRKSGIWPTSLILKYRIILCWYDFWKTSSRDRGAVCRLLPWEGGSDQTVLNDRRDSHYAVQISFLLKFVSFYFESDGDGDFFLQFGPILPISCIAVSF